VQYAKRVRWYWYESGRHVPAAGVRIGLAHREDCRQGAFRNRPVRAHRDAERIPMAVVWLLQPEFTCQVCWGRELRDMDARIAAMGVTS
jgi:hypothetical protein